MADENRKSKPSSSSASQERKVVIKSADMNDEMQKEAIACAIAVSNLAPFSLILIFLPVSSAFGVFFYPDFFFFALLFGNRWNCLGI